MAENIDQSGKNKFKMRYVFYFVLLLLFILALASHHASDMAILEGGSTGKVKNLVGPLGAWISMWLFYLFGVAVYPMTILLELCIFRGFFRPVPERKGYLYYLLCILFGMTILFALYPGSFLNITSYLGIGHAGEKDLALSGGTVGQFLAAPETRYLPAGLIRRCIGEIGTMVVALAFLLTGLVMVIIADWKQVFAQHLDWSFSIRRKPKEPAAEEEYHHDPVRYGAEPQQEVQNPAPARPAPYRVPEEAAPEPLAPAPQSPPPAQVYEPEPEHVPIPAPAAVPERKSVPPSSAAPIPVVNAQNGSKDESAITSQLKGQGKADYSGQQDYMLPPIKLFDEPKMNNTEDTAHLEHSQNVLQSVLESFNVAGRVVKAVVGPRVTRFVIELDPGVKVGLVTGLESNIAMEMKAESVRILAPIPGEGNIGVEVPNKKSSTVYIRSLFESEEWQNATGNASSIPIVLGRDVAGRTVIANLAKAPHLLIAGSTGSGKSVCMNSLIMSLLQKFSPYDLRMILVDPKHVELAMYRPIPHLITPVVNDPKQVPLALRWADNEMERRYRLLASVKAKNLKAFNNRQKSDVPELDDDGNPVPERLPLLVIIIDELADIMMTEAKKDVETSICRIAQKGRAAGIHLVIATQTPRKDVITGLIKANLPTKIAFRVTSGIDSRVILDTGGAESLLGNGDMLFMAPGGEGLERVQGTLVEDPEIQRVVDFISVQVPQQFDSQVVSEAEIVDTNKPTAKEIAEAEAEDEIHEPSLYAPSSSAVRSIVARYMKPGDNDLMRRALEIILEEKRVSTSYLQRRLGIGYNKSAELIDELEHRGIVSAPLPGGQKRDILILDELLETNQI